MTTVHGPRPVAVVVPARDEAALLPRCLAAVASAAAEVSARADVRVIVVADRCLDDTAGVAARALAGLDAAVVRVAAGNVGTARRAGVALAERLVAPHGRDRLWIAMTDADSVVPAQWLGAQLAACDDGWDAVSGPVAVVDWTARHGGTAEALERYRRRQRVANTVPVHGANLGVRAAALQSVGGVPALHLAEDAAMVDALERAGRRVLRACGPAVSTSARRSGRAPGGFSSLLDDLQRKEPA